MTNAPKPPTALDRLREERAAVAEALGSARTALAEQAQEVACWKARMEMLDLAISLISEQPAAGERE